LLGKEAIEAVRRGLDSGEKVDARKTGIHELVWSSFIKSKKHHFPLRT
jgi:hypothetical protein